MAKPARTGIGIIGTGFIAASHAAAAAVLPGMEVVAVADQNPAAAATFVQRWGGRSVASSDELLADPQVDAVIICTPNDTHAPLALAAVQAGKHVLLEKPMALSMADAQAIRSAAAQAGVCLLVGHTHRHADYARAVTEVVRSGELGAVRAVRLVITGGWLWGDWRAWVLDPERSGGHAFHNGVHLYDLASWWLGSPIASVLASGQAVTSGALRIDDYLCTTLVAQNGATAVCEISRGERPRTTNVFEIVVHGERGTLLRRWDSDGLVAFTDQAAGAVGAPMSDPFVAQLREWQGAIAAGRDPDPSPDLAVHVTAVAEAVERSARSGQVEQVPA